MAIGAVGLCAIMGVSGSAALGSVQSAPIPIDVEPNDDELQVGGESITGGVLYSGEVADWNGLDVFSLVFARRAIVNVGLASLSGCELTANITVNGLSEYEWSNSTPELAVGPTQELSVRRFDGPTSAALSITAPSWQGPFPCRWQVILGPQSTAYGPGITWLQKPPAPTARVRSTARTQRATIRALPPAGTGGNYARLMVGGFALTEGDLYDAGEIRGPIRQITEGVPVRHTFTLRPRWSNASAWMQIAPTPTGPWRDGPVVDFDPPPHVATATFAEGAGGKLRPKRIVVGRSFCSPLIRGIRWRSWGMKRAVGNGRGIVARWTDGITCAEMAQRAGVKRTRVILDRRCGKHNHFSRITLKQGGKRVYRYTARCGLY